MKLKECICQFISKFLGYQNTDINKSLINRSLSAWSTSLSQLTLKLKCPRCPTLRFLIKESLLHNTFKEETNQDRKEAPITVL